MARSLMLCKACARSTSRSVAPVYFPATSQLTFRSRRMYAGLVQQVRDGPRLALDEEKRRPQRRDQESGAGNWDAYNVARRVAKLAANNVEEAKQLLNHATQHVDMVVGWNHVLEAELRQGRVSSAWRTFNDMKKRAQKPNDRTYTIVFRGLTRCKLPKEAVQATLRYWSILMKDKNVEPNEFHINAALNVCAWANDLDSMFTIANSLDESDLKPTALTYTIIFNAMRHKSVLDLKGLPPIEREAMTTKLIERAEGLWEEALGKWKKGDLRLDEEMVCAMCRIYLMSSGDAAKEKILDVLERTMKLPNLLKTPSLDLSRNDEDLQRLRNVSAEWKKPFRDQDKIVYPAPGSNTLSVVLNVLTMTRHTTLGTSYWKLLVRHWGVSPDANNWNSFLRMLHKAKASAYVTAVLTDGHMPSHFIKVEHFRLAMETCVRDNINPNVLRNSTRALEGMLKIATLPDLRVLSLHLWVALVSHHRLRWMEEKGKATKARRMYGKQITEALGRIWPSYQQVHYRLFDSPRSPDDLDNTTIFQQQLDVIALARQMHGAFHKLQVEDLLENHELAHANETLSRLTKDIHNFHDGIVNYAPKGTDATPARLKDLAADFGRTPPGANFVWNTRVNPGSEVHERESFAANGYLFNKGSQSRTGPVPVYGQLDQPEKRTREKRTPEKQTAQSGKDWTGWDTESWQHEGYEAFGDSRLRRITMHDALFNNYTPPSGTGEEPIKRREENYLSPQVKPARVDLSQKPRPIPRFGVRGKWH